MRAALSKSGFTLIELSIVLVIIGLVAGGALVGRDLIKASEIRGTISQLEKYKTAVNTFKLKYHCLPGDCNNALSKGLKSGEGYWIGSAFIPAPADGDLGNNDGLISEYYGIADPRSAVIVNGAQYLNIEAINFWSHLGSAGLAENPTTPNAYYNHPFTKLGHGNWVAVTSYDRANALAIVEEYGGNFTTAQARCSGETYCPSLSPYEAFKIDEKIDDGLPSPLVESGGFYSSGGKGGVYAQYGFTFSNQWWSLNPVSQGAEGSNNCVNNTTTPPTYNVKVITTNLCLLLFKAGY